MTRLWTAPLWALLLGAAIPTRDLLAQRRDSSDRGRAPAVSLGQNYPNPFSADTRIPFTIGDPATCRDPVRTYRVTLRIYNLLSQEVAVPVLAGGPLGTPGGPPLENVPLACGTYLAYWDGRFSSTQKDAAPAMYLFRIEVEATVVTKKMVLAR